MAFEHRTGTVPQNRHGPPHTKLGLLDVPSCGLASCEQDRPDGPDRQRSRRPWTISPQIARVARSRPRSHPRVVLIGCDESRLHLGDRHTAPHRAPSRPIAPNQLARPPGSGARPRYGRPHRDGHHVPCLSSPAGHGSQPDPLARPGREHAGMLAPAGPTRRGRSHGTSVNLAPGRFSRQPSRIRQCDRGSVGPVSGDGR